ncbi:MAG: sigma-54 dependent transcriptional regulator [Thermodesulfobacteriota bacterium]
MTGDKIIVVDDERSMREFLEIMLRKEGYEVRSFSSAEDGLAHFKEDSADLVIADMKMPGMGGVELLKALKELRPDVTTIMITAYASVDTAVEAMKAGAYDYFTKPFNVEEIKIHIKRAIEWKRMERENVLLKKDLKAKYGFSNLIGTAPKMVELYELIMSVARTKTTVFITGESGTGKELVARAIHYESDRKEKPFVTINCGAIPENLLESELFGHQRGAFTGAVSTKQGLAELADGGTLFLDEITELPPSLQVKLLRFIQEKNFRRVGGTADINVDLRLVAASNRDVELEVREGRFREDLFYRLNVIRFSIPPLRERKDDIPMLARHFADSYAAEYGKKLGGITEEALKLLLDYDYSGNVRELENAIERAVAVERGEAISAESLPPSVREGGVPSRLSPLSPSRPGAPLTLPDAAEAVDIPPEGMDLEKAVSDFERAIIMGALKKAGGVKKKAAELLGLTFRSMRYKLSKYEDRSDRES